VQGMAVCLALASMEDMHAGSAIGLHLLSRKRGCELETEGGDSGRESPSGVDVRLPIAQRVVRPRLAETWFRPLEVAAMNAEPPPPQEEAAMHVEPPPPQDEVAARVDRHGDVNLLGSPPHPTPEGW